MLRQSLVKGTLILTLAGFLTRILGFFYRIWLSGQLGAELVGIYQLVFPVYGVCFTIYGAGIQTAISKLIAEAERFLPKTLSSDYTTSLKAVSKRIFSCGLAASLSLASILSFALYHFAPAIATHFLMEARAVSSLRLLSLIFPFCSITACVNGYYYGVGKSSIPAFSQILEQTVRILSVSIPACMLFVRSISCELAVLGLICGEAASAVFHLCSLFFECFGSHSNAKVAFKNRCIFKELRQLALPLSFHRLIISLLHSFESTLVPFTLKQHGLTSVAALSTYGIINSMSLPFIFFPTAITGALSVLLLPAVSMASIRGETKKLNSTIYLAQKFSILLGVISTALFLIFGRDLGNILFDEPLAGDYLKILAWLCPFLYVSSTFHSILNGLGKPYRSFLNSIIAMCIKLSIILFAIPKYGIQAYFLSILCSQIALTVLDGRLVYRFIGPSCLPDCYLLKAALVLTLLGLIIAPLYQYGKAAIPSPWISLAVYGGSYALCALLIFFAGSILIPSEFTNIKA